jgi:xylulose-5-phosphate/fructose-6-phosphate phosphoketolase
MSDVDALKKYTRLADYLSVAQIFLRDNFLKEKPLAPEHIKHRLLGHWGTSPGINFVQANINRLIVKNEKRDFLYVVGPGHGFPAFQAGLFIEGSLSRYYPEKIPFSRAGFEEVAANFSVPYGYPSHLNPEAPHQ